MNSAQPDTESLSPLKRALLALKDMQARLDAVERAQNEPIAILGMGCRFPGGSDNPEAFWHMLRAGVDGISEVPRERWDVDAYYDPDPAIPGKMNTRWGGFINHVDQFDAGFFAISPREALWMDPQQRLLLEVAWEALEDAGQTAARWSAGPTGVFIGICSSDYLWHQFSDSTDLDAYTSTGNSFSIAANRLSYLLDFKGPSLAVDTACSSSLVTVHLACQSLRNRECDLALAGGVNLMLSPVGSITLSKYGMMAPDGRCKTFDAAADGFVRGEGCGVVVLKRLSDALAAGDPIRALIRGSAVNQDGRSNGLTAPNVISQQEVIRQALAQAGVTPGEVQYVEAHGTGTPLGDPIEIEALAAVLGRSGNRCRLGSVKANIGHLEAAAGIAGLIKVVLALQYQAIPPQLHFRSLNPHIDLANTSLEIGAEGTPWPREDRTRIAGLSAFGFGGTNAHAVLEEAPTPPQAQAEPVGTLEPERVHLLPLSARSPQALAALVRTYREFLQGGYELRDVCYTASMRRNHHVHRQAVVGSSLREMAARLLDPEPAGIAPTLGPVFLFGDQGAEWAGMGRELLEQEPVFRQAVEECETLLRHYVRWSLTEELRAEGARSRLSDLEIAQPALFALQVGLAALWRSWGIQPSALVGQGAGEIGAAYVAGALTLADAVRIALCRGSLMQRIQEQRGEQRSGAMAAVEMSLEDADWSLDDTTAALSGETAGAITATLQRRDIAHRGMKTPHVLHSSQRADLSAELENALRGVRGHRAVLPIFSTLTGHACDGTGFDAGYWARQMRGPARFADAIQALIETGHQVFVELSPHPVLERSVADCRKDAITLPSLRRNFGEREEMLNSLGRLYTLGYTIAWEGIYPDRGPEQGPQHLGKHVTLPPYPWQHERFWPAKRSHSHRGGAGSRPVHPLLGAYLQPAADPGLHCWQTDLDSESVPYLSDHRVQGAMLMPAAAYVEIALAASSTSLGEGPHAIQKLAFTRTLFLREDRTQTIQSTLSAHAETAAFQFFSQQQGAWQLHATGEVVRGTAASSHDPLEQTRARCTELIGVEDYYRALHKQGLEYGPSFQGVAQIWRRDGEAIGKLRVAEAASPYQVHPALLDAAFQVLGLALPKEEARRREGDLYLPVGIDRVQLYGRPNSQLWAHAIFREVGETLAGDVFLLDASGRAVMEVYGLRLRRLGHGMRADTADWLYTLQWQAKPRAEAATRWTGNCLVVSGGESISEALGQLIREHGGRCVSQAFLPEFRNIGMNACATDVVHVCDSGAPADLRTALELVQALAGAAMPQPPRLWLVTRGAQFVAAEPRQLDVAHTPLAGLARVIAVEHPELWGGLIDLDPQSDPAAAARDLWEEITHADGENQVAYRGGQRCAARLERYQAVPAEPLCLRDDATYLVTGGLGGLGLEVARWMIDRGARHLLLLGRRPASETASDVIAQWERNGTSVAVVQADVSSTGQMAEALSAIDARFPLRGIVHAAGILDDGLLLQQDWDRFTRVMSPKVEGAWNLHNLTLGRELDFFVMFSSMASLLGTPGQGNYAAANAFLDGLAAYRRGLGLPALSINWGPWADVGMAAAQGQMDERMKRAGMRALPPRAALQVMEEMMMQPPSQPSAQVGVMDLDWRRFQPGDTPLPLLTGLLQPAAAAPAPQHSHFLDALRAVPVEDRPPLLEDYLRQQLGRVLRAAPSSIDAQSPLSHLGIDSLMAIELRTKVQADLRVAVPIALILQGPTLQQMTVVLLEQLTIQWLAEVPDADDQDWEVLTI